MSLSTMLKALAGRLWLGGRALLLAAVSVTPAFAQTNPSAQALPYTADFRTLAASSSTYPTGWQGWVNGAPGAAYLTTGPTANQALAASSSASTTTGGVHNYTGKFGPLDNGTSDFGLALALNTTGASGVVVSYQAMTLRNPYDGAANTRINELALQYRVGIAGAWTTLPSTAYQNNTVTQTGSGVVTPQNIAHLSVTLPPACDNQAVVQLRWAQREVSGGGSRPSFAVDNVSAQQPPAGNQATALQFDGVDDYVTFGQAPALGVSTFTIETWFRRTGAGVAMSTGTGGIASFIPLVTKGFGEGDGGTIDANFLFGINTSGNVIAADYEEGTGQTSAGLNHPISGVTPIINNTWYHGAVTFDGTTLRLYLNGVLENTVVVGVNRLPQSSSIQHAALGTGLNSTGGVGSTLGFFQGQLDEARIWNLARPVCDITGSMNLELLSGSGLVARWGMHDGAGVGLSNSLSPPNGILMNGATWVAGSPFNAPVPTLSAPTGFSVTALDAVQVQLGWVDNASGETGYQVERSTTGVGGPFTLIATLPADATGYLDAPVAAASQYCYRVRAVSTCTNSGYTSELCATTTPDCSALQFDPDGLGTDAYVTFGNPAILQLSALTLEMWIRRDGAGVGTDTGAGGIPNLIPLIAKGRAQAEVAAQDINYIFGIRASDGVLCADFEEGPAGASPSLNHPVAGTTSIGTGVWHHVAATYDGSTWTLYLDGVQEASLLAGQPLGSASTVAVALASALNSSNAPSGFFDGAMDEVRVWNVARSAAQIQADLNSQITTPQAGLVARWALDEGTGTVVYGTAGTALNGTIVGTSGSNWSRSACAPFNITFTPPTAPTGLSAVAASFNQVDLTWTDASLNETGFELERSTTGIAGPYSLLITLPAGSASYSNTGLTASSEYCYRVRAVNAFGSSGYAGPSCATTAGPPNYALGFSGTAGSPTYASVGSPASLQLSAFTIETWLRRDGAGEGTNTGSGGIADAIPLVAKGRADTESPTADINYLFGIRAGTGTLCGDFEEGAAGASPSLNHPIEGVTPLTVGTWYHAAATYDGVTWKLYLNGNLEASLPIGQPLASASTVATSLASALTSGNAPAGFFNGALDEVRIWNVARDQSQIRSTANIQLSSATPGLVARWAMDEGTGSLVGASAGTTVNGTITGPNSAWVTPGAPFNLAFNQQPGVPLVLNPANGATGVATSPTLEVSVTDPDGDPVTVTWYGRPVAGAPGPDFTVIGLPDTQYYTSQINGGSNAIFQSQTNWLVANRLARNIVYVGQLGDCVENGDNGGNNIEWQRADASLSILENPLTTGMPEGIPFGVSVGNHDQSPIGSADGTTTFYNQFFGSSRFTGRSYYGGHYGTNNDNWYELFSASGMDFIVLSFEYDTTPDAAVLAWADNLLSVHSNRRAIVLSHFIINTGNPGGYGPQGQAIYDALKARPNLDIVLCGHVPGEGRRQDTFGGNTVHTMLSDYQSRTAGGNGWMRLLEFSPANNEIRVKTYSPWLDQFETDGDSQFTLPYNMNSAPDFQVIGTSSGVASGSTASISWPGLAPGTQYEWYASVSDGSSATLGTSSTFTTAATPSHTITATAGPNGTIAPSGAVTVVSGASQAFTFTPAANHHVAQVTVDSSPVAVAPGFTFTNVTSPHTIDVQFAIDSYTLTYQAGPNGSITGTTPQIVNHGSNGTAVTAVPAAGHHFVSWSDGVLTAARTELNVTANVTVTASFAINQYTLSYLAGSNGGISGTASQLVNHGSSGTAVTGVANPGYHFVSWSDGVLTASRTDSNVQADLTTTASFALDTPVSTSVVQVGPPSGLITSGTPVRTVPVTISRTDLTPLLAFSVTFSVSPPLSLSGGTGGIHEGTYLSSATPATSFNIIDLGLDGFGNHRYEADGTTLGAPCGASAASGTLFTIDVASAAAAGSGSVTITSLTLRNCSNADLPGVIGTSATVTVDQSAPSVQLLTPNGGENWRVGSSQAIQWTGSDAEGVAGFDLAYSTDGGTTFPNAIASVPGGQTSYAWTIPAAPGTATRVRVTAHDTNDNSAADASDANFTIAYYALSYLAGPGGTISGTTPQSVSHGGSGTAVTAVPDAGYHFVSWSDGVLTTSRTDTNVTADLMVTASFALNQYTLTYLAGPNGTISGTTPQLVSHGGSGTAVTAVANPGYHFVSWSDGVLTASRTDSNVLADLTVTASFALNQYTLTYLAGPNGTISGTTPQTVNHGGSGTAVTAVANIGYHFVSWSDGVLTASRTDSNVLADLTVTASFAINQYTLTYLAGPNGTISGTTPQTVNHGGSGTAVMAVPNVGYHFVSWSDGVLTASRTDSNVMADLTVTASFAINQYTLTYLAGPNGTISGTTTQSVSHGGSGTAVTAVANVGYHFVSWSDGVLTASRTDTNVLADLTVTASFAINQYTLTYLAGPNGTISGTTPQTVTHGGSGTAVTAVPNVGYHFVSWSDGVLTASRTDSNVLADLTVTASFAINQYTLTYLAGPNGTISGTTPQTVNHGGSGTAVTAVPNVGYHFVSWSDGVLTASRTDSNVLGDLTVTASFAITQYTLTYLAGPNGTISGTTPQTVNHGGSGTAVTAVANAGYHFVSWSDGVLTASRTDTNVMADLTVTASFALNQYTLTYLAGPNGSISGTTPQSVSHGGSGTAVTAVANAGYHFVSWSDGVLTASRTDSNVLADLTVTASFALNQYTLTYLAGPNGTISGTTPQTVNHGGSGTAVTAVANIGYHFVSWSDGVLTASRTDSNVQANVTASASFLANPPVAAVANLAATQVVPGTLGSGTTPIQLTWDATPVGTTVEIWRQGFGSYPEYDDAGGAVPSVVPSYPPGAGWVKVAGLTTPGGQDLPLTRDFYYYVAYAQDGFGSWSPPSALTSGTLDYHLGDASNGIAAGSGNNKVFSEDISLLGAHYGKIGAAMTAVNYLDVGPTSSGFVNGRPLTDNKIEFEDLVLFAINYGLGQPGQAAAPVSGASGSTAVDELLLEAPERVTTGQIVTVRLNLRGSGKLIALATQLAWDPAVVEPVSHTAGAWWASHDGQVFSARPGSVDVAALGGRGLAGEGELAVVTFRVLVAGEPRIRIGSLEGRDALNHKVEVARSQQVQAAVVPVRTQLALGRPNPFRDKVSFPFSLSAAGTVDLSLYSVDGRRVRTLMRGLTEPGEYDVVWDGRDDDGRAVVAGVYYARLETPRGRFTRTIIHVK